jgi:hypothetical protein
MNCRSEWHAAAQALMLGTAGNIRRVRRSLGTPGVTRENFPKHDGVATLAEVQTVNTQNQGIFRISGSACTYSGQTSGTGTMRLMNESAQPVSSQPIVIVTSSQSTTCEVRRGRHLEN